MARRTRRALAGALLMTAGLAAPAWAGGDRHGGAFDHVGTFDVPQNLRAGEPPGTVTSAEIVDATSDGRTLLYTDSPTGRLGFVDVKRPHAPRAGGTIDMGGEPTSVAALDR